MASSDPCVALPYCRIDPLAWELLTASCNVLTPSRKNVDNYVQFSTLLDGVNFRVGVKVGVRQLGMGSGDTARNGKW